MNRARIFAVAAREALEIRRNRMVLLSMLLLPLVMVGVLIATLLTVADLTAAELAAQGFSPPAELAHLSLNAAVAVIVNDQNLLYLMLTPTLLPIVIGAYSIIGEKETRTLEPLLATPITIGELVTGKTLAALTPAVSIGLLQLALGLAAIAALSPPEVFAEAVRPLWLIGFLVVMPLLAALSTLLAIAVSTRVSDVRSAQAIASLVILPVVGTGAAVLVGQLYLTPTVMLGAAAVLAVLDLTVGRLAVRAFGRETILSRLGGA